jgi:autotransporter passenger strand-loop-strand repeat protein
VASSANEISDVHHPPNHGPEEESAMTSGFVNPGQTLTNFLIGPSESLVVSAGGQVNVVYDEGLLQVYGKAENVVVFGIRAGGVPSEEYVASGGEAVHTTIMDGGYQSLTGAATKAQFTLIFLGGTQYVTVGSTATDTHVLSGGVESVSNAYAIRTVIEAGGTENLSVAAVSYDTVINGGTLAFFGAAAVWNTHGIAFTDAGGYLQFDNQSLGFSSTKLRLVFTQGSDDSGTLSVTNGYVSYSITLHGHYSTADFSVAAGSNGGTLITEHPTLPVGGLDAQPASPVNTVGNAETPDAIAAVAAHHIL